MIFQERVIALQGTSKMSLLSLQKLERRRLTIIIHVLLVSQAIQTDTTIVSDAVLLHYLIDAVEDKRRLAVVGLHRLINNLGQLGVVTDKEPGIYGDTMTSHSRAWLENVYARVHVANLDNLIHIHVVMAADTRKLIGKGNIHSTEGVLHDL